MVFIFVVIQCIIIGRNIEFTMLLLFLLLTKRRPIKLEIKIIILYSAIITPERSVLTLKLWSFLHKQNSCVDSGVLILCSSLDVDGVELHCRSLK